MKRLPEGLASDIISKSGKSIKNSKNGFNNVRYQDLPDSNVGCEKLLDRRCRRYYCFGGEELFKFSASGISIEEANEQNLMRSISSSSVVQGACFEFPDLRFSRNWRLDVSIR